MGQRGFEIACLTIDIWQYRVVRWAEFCCIGGKTPSMEVFQQASSATHERRDLVFNAQYPLIFLWRHEDMENIVVSKLRYKNSAGPPIVRACIEEL